MVSEQNEPIINCQGISYTFSNEKNKYPFSIILLSENPSNLHSVEPIKCRTSSGRVIYINSFNLGLFKTASHLLQHIVSSDDPVLRESYNRIEIASNQIAYNATNTIKALIESIDKVFSLASVDSSALYNFTDLRQGKGKLSVKDRIKYVDTNVKSFLKNNRIYAGLAFLKDAIASLRFGFAIHDATHWINDAPFYKGTPPKAKVIFYTSCIFWTYSDDRGLEIDKEGDILNKIVENLFLLLSATEHSEPVVNLYKKLHGNVHIKLKADVLVRLIEALVKHNEVQVLEPAIAQLKTMEPRHPIIDVADRTIRRIKVFDQISRAYNINLSEIQNMGGIDFEKFLESQFIRHGFNVERTKASGDFGADLIVETKSGTRAAVQAKRFKQKTNLKAVQEVVASISHYASDFGIVVATSGFFQSAIELAKSNNVELWDEDKLIRFLGGDVSFSVLGSD